MVIHESSSKETSLPWKLEFHAKSRNKHCIQKVQGWNVPDVLLEALKEALGAKPEEKAMGPDRPHQEGLRSPGTKKESIWRF